MNQNSNYPSKFQTMKNHLFCLWRQQTKMPPVALVFSFGYQPVVLCLLASVTDNTGHFLRLGHPVSGMPHKMLMGLAHAIGGHLPPLCIEQDFKISCGAITKQAIMKIETDTLPWGYRFNKFLN